ncbi:NADH-ubiquinone oxidoreductase subunit NDUFA12 family protein [Siccirubricoccus sp. KC 17139]|uniref:NADH-ubiquinone oxidoreductase subunit NDUFA12 family protein n=1 Tax=Siccirubricoccus soli TaxID=2899147 RepID=A0ABT1D5J9_9PROT|nr:NADH-ubiquinone oxidoreductase subunit NDUFA12 family protein [Siccirubricoccus soli]MCO6416280.1 NADH-ubiquinone oxidoreductase subunit NDUFA12 family protein [Siccirubricoccus soli]MCP2682414.1 NADH-ubiquinone oxidoreductase subunit NDUFA12 family protein [Siccirubricoccus soli]
MSFLLRLTSRLTGRQVGTDRFGNVYFESRRLQPIYNRPRRWAIYARGGREPTVVPPEWHAWLHHTVAEPLPEQKRYPWQQEHRPNLTGTPESYRPAGHDYVGGTRRVTGGDYEAWTPGA